MPPQLVFDFGVMPDYVVLGTGPRVSHHTTNVRWKLELWASEESWQLRHHKNLVEISGVLGCQLLCSYARPARGPGYCILTLAKEDERTGHSLLNGRIDDLQWLRDTALALITCWDIPFHEQDWGIDD